MRHEKECTWIAGDSSEEIWFSKPRNKDWACGRVGEKEPDDESHGVVVVVVEPSGSAGDGGWEQDAADLVRGEFPHLHRIQFVSTADPKPVLILSDEGQLLVLFA